MHEIILVPPAKEHELKAIEFKDEFLRHDEKIINGSSLFDQMEFEEWIIHLAKSSKQQTVDENWVPSTTLFALRIKDERITGIIDIRHHINHPFLYEFGGHIGYAVRPSERRKGYATSMLSLALGLAKDLGLESVMLGCYADNIGSIKTILKNGGILTNTKPYYDGKLVNIYQISTTK